MQKSRRVPHAIALATALAGGVSAFGSGWYLNGFIDPGGNMLDIVDVEMCVIDSPFMRPYDGPWVHMGTSTPDGPLSSINLTGDAPAMFGVASAAAGDLDGDGLADVLVGSPAAHGVGDFAGRVQVFSAADGSQLMDLAGPAGRAFFGRSVAAAGDVNGDGTPDILVGDWTYDGLGLPIARVHVFSGADSTLIVTIESQNRDDGFGYAMTPIGDHDGDGYGDIAISAPLKPSTVSGCTGATYVFLGADMMAGSGALTTASASATLWNDSPNTVLYGAALARVEAQGAAGPSNVLITSLLDDPTVTAGTYSVTSARYSADGLGGIVVAAEPIGIAGDVDMSNTVNADDLTLVLATYGTTIGGTQIVSGDTNADGVVNADDVLQVLTDMGGELTLYRQTANDVQLATRLRQMPRYDAAGAVPYPLDAAAGMPAAMGLTPQFPGVYQPGRIVPIVGQVDPGDDPVVGDVDTCDDGGDSGGLPGDCDGDGFVDPGPLDSDCDGFPDGDCDYDGEVDDGPMDSDCDGIPDSEDCDHDGADDPTTPCDECGDDDGDGRKNQNDCDSPDCYYGDPELDCECADYDRDGQKNQDDCDSPCYTGNKREDCCDDNNG